MNQVFQGNEESTSSTEGPDKEVDQSSLAWKIFTAFVSNGHVSATEEELMAYAEKDLNVNIAKLPTGLAEAFPLIIVAFMNMWSGWHFKGEFLAGKFKKEHYFNRFQKFMTHKIKVTINSHYNVATKGVQEYQDKYKSAMKSTGARAVPPKPNNEFLPYSISIKCPPHMLNTIVFSNVGDDVIMKQHLGSAWRDLNTAQLVNWPHVEVTFQTEDLRFVRKQATEFVRYLNFLPHECKKVDRDFIEHVEFVRNSGRRRSCYTIRFLQEYIKEYVQALKTVKEITPTKLEETIAILAQFIEDVKYINVNASMVTNTTVLFRLASAPFIRNKKLIKSTDKEGDEARVGYCEIIIPKIELVMSYFGAKQKNTNHISFESTDKIRSGANSNISGLLPFISYKCTFCKVEYHLSNAKKQILEHLKNEHKMEQHVRCTVCKKQFDVLNLANCRWRHKCL